MENAVAVRALQVIREERERRILSLSRDSQVAYDQWLFDEAPLLNELCLTVLLAIHHQIEREIIHLSARATKDGRDLSPSDYRSRVEAERKRYGTYSRRQAMVSRLGLAQIPEWPAVEILRHLANSYKHDTDGGPSSALLTELGLDSSASYDTLAQSDAVASALSRSLGLSGDPDLCQVAEQLLARAEAFVASARKAQAALSTVQWGPVSMNPVDFRR